MDLSDKNIQAIISEFLTRYDISDLTQALQHYTDMHQEYICRTKASISKLKISWQHNNRNTPMHSPMIFPDLSCSEMHPMLHCYLRQSMLSSYCFLLSFLFYILPNSV